MHTSVFSSSNSEIWREKLQSELSFIHKTIRDTHPGVLLEQKDPVFQKWFTEGYQRTQQMLARANNEKQGQAALYYYIAGYQDGHLDIRFDQHGKDASTDWAGWVMQKRGAHFVVVEAAENWPQPLPPLHTKVISCDGVPVADYLQQRIAPYVDQRGFYYSWQRNALRLTVESSDAASLWDQSRTQVCEVETAAGERQTYPLFWQAVDKNSIKARLWKQEPQQTKQLQDGVCWIRATDFMLGDKGRESLEVMLEQIRKLHQARLVVLDVRGNGGGSSLVGYRILKALYKDQTPDFSSEATAHFRISPVAIEQFERAAEHVKKTYAESSMEYQFINKLSDALRLAQQRGEVWLQQPDIDLEQEFEETGEPFNGQLVLVTDSTCASACLDFADMVLRIPDAIHLGLPTSGDTNYLESPTIKTPGGLHLAVPLKVWHNRSRGSNEFYTPQYLYDGDITDTAAVQKWVLDTVLHR